VYVYIYIYIYIKQIYTYRLKVPTIREEVTKFSVKYRGKITTHLNELASHYLKKNSLED